MTSFSIDVSFRNVFLGVTAVSGTATLCDNVIGGYNAALNVSQPLVNNVILGPIAMASSQRVESNVAIGNAAGAFATTVCGNILHGIAAGYSVSGFASNVVIGHSAGQYQRESSNNIFLGYGTGYGESGAPPISNMKNVVVGDGTLRFSSSNSSNIVMGVTSLNNSSNNSGCIVFGNNVGPITNCSSVVSIGHSNLTNFTGTSNIFLGNNIGANATATNTIAIGHGINVSGMVGKIVIGTSNRTYFYADGSSNKIFLGGLSTPYSLSSDGSVQSNTVSLMQVVLQGECFNPYTMMLSVSTGQVLPIVPYIFLDQSSSATRVVLDTDLSAALTSNTYNLDIVIGNNRPTAITLCGSFFSVNQTISRTPSIVLSGNMIKKFKRMLFVNPSSPFSSERYYIGYLQQ
jgi:hypothetical protein